MGSKRHPSGIPEEGWQGSGAAHFLELLIRCQHPCIGTETRAAVLAVLFIGPGSEPGTK